MKAYSRLKKLVPTEDAFVTLTGGRMLSRDNSLEIDKMELATLPS